MPRADDFASWITWAGVFGAWKEKVHLVNAALMLVIGLFMRNDHVCDL